MCLNIRNLSVGLLLTLCTTAFSQEDTIQETNKSKPQIGKISIAAFNAMPVGDNFAADAYAPKIGAQVSFAFNLFSSGFMIGGEFSFYNTNIKNVQAAGNYDRTNVYFYNVVAGYQMDLSEEFKFTASVGFGPSNYSSKSEDVSFNDTGYGVWLRPDVSYKFHQNLGVFFSSTFRRDFMNIEAPSSSGNYFKHVDYINLGLGIRIYF